METKKSKEEKYEAWYKVIDKNRQFIKSKAYMNFQFSMVITIILLAFLIFVTVVIVKGSNNIEKNVNMPMLYTWLNILIFMFLVSLYFTTIFIIELLILHKFEQGASHDDIMPNIKAYVNMAFKKYPTKQLEMLNVKDEEIEALVHKDDDKKM